MGIIKPFLGILVKPVFRDLLADGVGMSKTLDIGWMVRRYAHLALEQFATHARVVDDLLNDTIASQQK